MKPGVFPFEKDAVVIRDDVWGQKGAKSISLSFSGIYLFLFFIFTLTGGFYTHEKVRYMPKKLESRC